MAKNKLYMVADFETTVYEGHQETSVWAVGSAFIDGRDVFIDNSIEAFFKRLFSLRKSLTCYFHNLAFDGAFILSYLINDLGFEQAFDISGKHEYITSKADMKNNTVNYTISSVGQWYEIKVKKYDRIITFRDSLKLAPFTLEEMAEAFNTSCKKLDIDYAKWRVPGATLTKDEENYITNDVIILKESLEYMFSEKHSKITIGSCCLSEYKNIIGRFKFAELFPNLDEFYLNKDEFGSGTANDYVAKSYRGGYRYVKEEYQGKVIKEKGITLDGVSLYSSEMHSHSKNLYPIGLPTFWKGDIPPFVLNKYFFVRIKTRFKLKEGYLPFLQIKGNALYVVNDYVRSSDYFDKKTGKYYSEIIKNGKKEKIYVTLTLTMTDYFMFLEHYDVQELEILDGCFFECTSKLFDKYIDKYINIKENSEGGKYALSKLFLNNLYGKFATKTENNFKIAYFDENGIMKTRCTSNNKKKSIYMPVGSAITAYGRKTTVSICQANYDHFIYCDTDSCHMLYKKHIKAVDIGNRLGQWKIESTWDSAIFAKQKTYIEHLTNGTYNIVCAGMSDSAKEILNCSLTGEFDSNKYSGEALEFVKKRRTLEDFKQGLTIPGILKKRYIRGGLVLSDVNFTLM